MIALGGNALGETPAEQLALVTETAKPIVDLVEQGNEIVIVHGDGPQIGMISLGMTTAAEANVIKSDRRKIRANNRILQSEPFVCSIK